MNNDESAPEPAAHVAGELVFHDDIDAQEAAFSFLELESRSLYHLPGLEIRHASYEQVDGCTSTLWAQGQLRAIAVRVRNDWNRTVLAVWVKPDTRAESAALQSAREQIEALTRKLTEIQHIADRYADVDDGRPNDMMRIIAILEGQP